MRLAVGGEELTQVWKNQRSYGVFVRFPDEMRGDLEAIGNLLVDTPVRARRYRSRRWRASPCRRARTSSGARR